jgi:putative oxidoreductase
VILNNGIEFGVTYLVMLLSLLFTGGGRFTSIDYYLSRLFPAQR